MSGKYCTDIIPCPTGSNSFAGRMRVGMRVSIGSNRVGISGIILFRIIKTNMNTEKHGRLLSIKKIHVAP
jgi:hypothetical protein